jgi:hypothetical protein
VAYVLRFVNCIKGYKKSSTAKSHPFPESALSAEEIAKAQLLCIKAVQTRWFAAEIAKLNSGSSTLKQSPMSSLTPFLDDEKVLRVGGQYKDVTVPLLG